jgi:hypothetical protein
MCFHFPLELLFETVFSLMNILQSMLEVHAEMHIGLHGKYLTLCNNQNWNMKSYNKVRELTTVCLPWQ